MNQQKINEISAKISKLFAKQSTKKVKSKVSVGGKLLPNTNKKSKKNSLVQKALKQNKANKKAKEKRNITPPKAKSKSKTMAQMKRNLRLINKQ